MTKRLVLSILLASALLTVSTVLAFSASAQSGPPQRALTPEQLRLVAQKERARAAAGVPAAPRRPDSNYAGPDAPARRFAGTVQVTKAELRARWQKQADYVASVERALVEAKRDPAEARQLRAELEALRAQIEALPDGPITVPMPGKEVGRHSIQWGAFTYDAGNNRKDPTNVIFFRVGKAWDVQYDMGNWAIPSRRWQLTCGGPQWVYIWDAQHTGGKDDWRQDEYQLEPAGSVNTCPGFGQVPAPLEPRDHIRLFGSFVEDSHTPSFGWWSTGDAHYDPPGHLCGGRWEDVERRIRDTFRDENGNNLWFVAQVYLSYVGYEGSYGCGETYDPFGLHYNDGWDSFIELTA